LAKQELAAALRALGELSPLCRQIFELNRFDGLSHGDIAGQLGVCVSTVEKTLRVRSITAGVA
jgi:DNA-directed RNA polymerase specialized sigma24 family protein